MSNRLESLNPKKAPAKPGLKFKPKAVARKSKEDRAKNSPEVKPEDHHRVQTSSRGRGSTRGRGRGRAASYVGTHVVSSGPLAMGSVAIGDGHTNSKTGLTSDKVFGVQSSNSSPFAGLRPSLSSHSSNVKDNGSDSDGDDPTKINMNMDYTFDDTTNTALFPVRPQKDTASMIEPELVLADPVSASTSASRTPFRPPTIESVKSEDTDEIAPAAAPVVDAAGNISNEERDKLLDDRRSIIDVISSQMDNLKTDSAAGDADNNYLLLHMPQITPKDNSGSSPAGTFASPVVPSFQGQVGSLNFHQSGRITVSLENGHVLDCARGNPSTFLQELYVMDTYEDVEHSEQMVVDSENRKISGKLFRLGNITDKIVATPVLQ